MKANHLFASQALRTGWFQFTEISVPLPSGRFFRYQMTDFPFRVETTVLQAEEIATRVVTAKYRFCLWDREHPKDDQELEIYCAVRDFILEQVRLAQELRALRNGEASETVPT